MSEVDHNLSFEALSQSSKRFTKWLWLLLLYTFFVILWGAFVRASGSGAGCGNHWPLCNGEFIPFNPSTQTLIEFTHRATSGLYGIYVLILVLLSFKYLPKGHLCRKASIASLFFTITEALIGARLVLLGLVAENSSIDRAIVITFHLLNTTFLIASIVFWIHSSFYKSYHKRFLPKNFLKGFLICSSLFLLVGISGAITALGDTLFPVDSLVEGLKNDLSYDSHLFVQLRVFHPFIAVAFVAAIFIFSKAYGTYIKVKLHSSLLPNSLIFLCFGGLAFGLVNLLLLAPIWAQMVHLLWANIIWSVLVMTFLRLRYTS